MISVGITGQSGFIGTHLYNTISLYNEQYELVPWEDTYFETADKFKLFVKQCDVIIHLAAVNRYADPQVIYDTNIKLVKQLIDALEATENKAHVIFASSTQEERDNPYGRSKKEGRMLFADWVERNGGRFTGMVIPNVFGPFGKPYYNSVIATFCHQLTHDETPKIDVDGKLKLIYVGELVQEIISIMENNNGEVKVNKLPVEHTSEKKVSELLAMLNAFKSEYYEKGIFPDISDTFTRNLFNTFVCYIDHDEFFPFHLKLNTDDRGSFVETVKLQSGGQVSFSTTKPGITRGNHFHTRKAERFAVIKGKARIEFRLIGTDKVYTFDLDGAQPSFVDMPIWYTHNITNTGDDELYTIFWINELFNPDDPDTYYEEV